MRFRTRIKFWLQHRLEKLTKEHVKCKDDYRRNQGPIHGWFSLSYASYYVVPRLALQGMPIWWQKLFIFLVNMLPSIDSDYVVQVRNARGRFGGDPWANYRRGSAEELIARDARIRAEHEHKRAADWKIISVESGNNVKRTNE